MKRYIKSDSEFKNSKGSGTRSNTRRGIYTFGKGQYIPLAGDCKLYLPTGYVRFDAISNKIQVYVNAQIDGTGVHQYFVGLSADEFETMYAEVSNMDEETLRSKFSSERKWDFS